MGGEAYCMGVNRLELAEKLQKGDKRWYNFNQSFDNLHVDALDLAGMISAGRAYTSWHDPSVRCAENWKCSQFLAVDMDTGDLRSSLDYIRRNDMVMGFAGLIHTTPSHSQECPRCRVVFFLDRPITNPKAYMEASKFMATILVPGADVAATDASRFFYGCQGGQVEVLGNTLSVDFLYDRYSRSRHKQAARKVQSEPLPPKAYGEVQLYDRISLALDKINPWDIEYKDWCAIIAAVKQELGDQGLELATRWADGKHGEVERMWKSFRRQGGNVAALGTIIHFAYEV